MKVSIIIAFYNNINWIRLIFNALNKQTFKDFEVIVADDGSRPEVVNELDSMVAQMPFKITHVWHEDIKWRKNLILNKAVVASDSDYLIFLDGDCIPHRCFVEDHYNFKQKNLVIAGRRFQLPAGLSDRLADKALEFNDLHNNILQQLSFWHLLTNKVKGIEDAIRIKWKLLRKIVPEKKKGLLGCNFSLYKADLLNVNGFDERYLNPGTGEDSDLELRLANAGTQLRVKRHLAIVYHRFHKREDTNSVDNKNIYEENKKYGVSWTPYGIKKLIKMQ